MPTKPTTKQIAHEIGKLEAILPLVPQLTAFKEDNHAAIRAQVVVLRTNASEQQILNAYEDCAGLRHQREAALDARRWLDGTGDTPSLADDWQSATA